MDTCFFQVQSFPLWVAGFFSFYSIKEFELIVFHANLSRIMMVIMVEVFCGRD